MMTSKGLRLVVCAMSLVALCVSMPCLAGWTYVGGDVSNGPTSGQLHTFDYGSDWMTEKDEGFDLSYIDSYQGDVYAHASASDFAYATAWGQSSGGSCAVGAFAYGETWSESRYANDEPAKPLYIDYYIEVEGAIDAAGAGDSNPYGSGNAYSMGSANMSAKEGGAYASAGGYVYGGSTGVPDGYTYNATGTRYDNCGLNYYEVSLDFSLNVQDVQAVYGTSYTAEARFYADAIGVATASGYCSAGSEAYSGCYGLVDLIITY